MEKEKWRELVSSRSLGGFAKRLIRLGGSQGVAKPGLPFPGQLLRTPLLAPCAAMPGPGGSSRGSADKTCMRTCAKINGCAYELMIAERIDAACPVHAVLLMNTSSGSAGRATDVLLQRLLHLYLFAF